MRVGPPGGVEVQVADEDWEFSFSESPIFALSGIPEKTADHKISVKYLAVLQKEILSFQIFHDHLTFTIRKRK